MNLTELGYVAGWRLARALPRPVVAAAFRAGADRAHRARGKAATRLRANLRRVVGPELPDPELDALVKQGLRSYARYWMEAFRLPSLSRRQILAGFHLGGSEMLAADVAAGRGAVVALPHAGNWDAAGAWVAANGWPITTVAERLKPEGVYERFLAFRQGLGMEILPTHGGARPAFDVLVDRLRSGAVVPLLADRDLSARGIEVDFFGARTKMPPGPALLTIRTGAPLYVASLWYEPEMPRAQLEGPLPVPEPDSAPLDERVRVLTQRIADRLATGIARHPQDWHMLQRMWLDQRGSTDGGPTAPPPPASAGSV
ncbi:phosphatidylinositol mannoside acyltransferase [Micromonospora sp. HUAS LYJ1]|uniref:phosphatidylinositol mannoside acyltransferase n=1 Tax=Micromonospora sp. HUAS LYJ1 TaxID=3061626 RepID=UPI002671732F|nr:phosphatidylinositol mannoside acyltransferase [Micromonospora sp. HUAS LYJ1]WKU05188.1 phosphatidylinositol mannoside acyltransferase [Micromonospora sp. HUAS LYJ1]